MPLVQRCGTNDFRLTRCGTANAKLRLCSACCVDAITAVTVIPSLEVAECCWFVFRPNDPYHLLRWARMHSLVSPVVLQKRTSCQWIADTVIKHGNGPYPESSCWQVLYDDWDMVQLWIEALPSRRILCEASWLYGIRYAATRHTDECKGSWVLHPLEPPMSAVCDYGNPYTYPFSSGIFYPGGGTVTVVIE